MAKIYHITTRLAWQQAQNKGAYRADSLETEGFIHCSTSVQVLGVANAFYADLPDLVLLCINPDLLTSELKWEAPAHPDKDKASAASDTQLFPHVYGAINLNAILDVLDLPKSDAGFILPDAVD